MIVMADTPPSSPRPTGPQQARIIELSTGLLEFSQNSVMTLLTNVPLCHIYFQQGENSSNRLRSRIPIASAEPSKPSVAYLNPGRGHIIGLLLSGVCWSTAMAGTGCSGPL